MQMVEQPAPPAKQVFIKHTLLTAITSLYIIIYAILYFIETHMMTIKVQQNTVDTPNHIDVQVVQWIQFGGIFKILTIGFTNSKILVSAGSPANTMVWQQLHAVASATPQQLNSYFSVIWESDIIMIKYNPCIIL
jgi:hypothetical protein